MIGLGVGIDYALFLVSRYRADRAEGRPRRRRSRPRSATTGTAIVFAGGTVVIALVTLLIAGIPLVTSLGYASAFAVVTAVLAAITLLPALLSLAAARSTRSRCPPSCTRSRSRRARASGPLGPVRHHPPGRSIAIMLAMLLPLMIPFFSLELGQEDIGATPKETTERKAYD